MTDGAGLSPSRVPVYVRLLDTDAGLAAAVPLIERHLARRLLRSAAYELEPGRFDPSQLRAGELRPVGLLVEDGLLARRLRIDGRTATQLFVQGDICRPWRSESADAAEPVEWLAYGPARVVVIDESVRAYAYRWPQLLSVLHDRLLDQLDEIAAMDVRRLPPQVEQRLLVVLRHLARRAGSITTEGAAVELPLTHALLAQLVGADRPAVSLALAALKAGGQVVRHGDLWLLPASFRPSAPEG